MVGAAEELAIATAGGRIAGAMAAHVIKAAENAILAPHDEQWLSDKLEGEVVAGLCGLVNVSYNLPGGGKDPGFFVRKGFCAEIERCRQGGSASDVAIGVELKIRHLTLQRAPFYSSRFSVPSSEFLMIAITLVPIARPPAFMHNFADW